MTKRDGGVVACRHDEYFYVPPIAMKRSQLSYGRGRLREPPFGEIIAENKRDHNMTNKTTGGIGGRRIAARRL